MRRVSWCEREGRQISGRTGQILVAHDKLDVSQRRLDTSIAGGLLVVVVQEKHHHRKVTLRPPLPETVTVHGCRHEAGESGWAERGDMREEDAIEGRRRLEGRQQQYDHFHSQRHRSSVVAVSGLLDELTPQLVAQCGLRHSDLHYGTQKGWSCFSRCHARLEVSERGFGLLRQLSHSIVVLLLLTAAGQLSDWVADALGLVGEGGGVSRRMAAQVGICGERAAAGRGQERDIGLGRTLGGGGDELAKKRRKGEGARSRGR